MKETTQEKSEEVENDAKEQEEEKEEDEDLRKMSFINYSITSILLN